MPLESPSTVRCPVTNVWQVSEDEREVEEGHTEGFEDEVDDDDDDELLELVEARVDDRVGFEDCCGWTVEHARLKKL